MGWVVPVVLLVGLLGLAGVVAGGVLLARRRARLGLALLVAGVAVLAAEEVVPRLLVPDELTVGCETTVTVRPALSATPLVVQALGGGLEAEALVPASEVTRVADDLLADSPLQDPSVSVGDDGVEVDADVDTPLGGLPIDVTLTPGVSNGAVSVEVTEARIVGLSLPGAVRDVLTRVAQGLAAVAASSTSCDPGSGSGGGSGSGAGGLTYTSVESGREGITVGVRL